MSENFLNEAFKDLKFLNEESFSFDKQGAEELAKFMDGDVSDEFEDIIDPEAENEEDLKDSYLGKAILCCNVCHSLVYKDPEDIHIDEASEDANVEEECPYCYSTDGFKIVGQVSEFKEEDDSEKTSDEGSEIEVKADVEDEKVEESVKNKRSFLKESSERDDIDADADDKKEQARKALMKKKDDADSDKDYKLKKADMKEPEQLKEESNIAKLKKAYPELNIEEKLEESDKPAATSIEDAQKWVDYDMKKYGEISGRTNDLIKKAGFQIIKDNHGDYEVTAGKFESLKEGFEKVEVETDTEKMSMTSDKDGKTTITTEPKNSKEEEFIAPVSAEVKAEIEAEEEPEEEVDIDEFDEESFDELGESYLKKVYDNVNSYKTSAAKISGNQLMLEGVIKFNSGKQAKTAFLFEASHKTAKGKLRFTGINKQITESKNSFIITGSVNNKKLLSEALTYNYKVKGAKDRVYGTIKK